MNGYATDGCEHAVSCNPAFSDKSRILPRRWGPGHRLDCDGGLTFIREHSSLYIKRGKVSVRTFVRNAGRGQLSSEWRHNENDVVRTGAASAVGARRANDVIMRTTSQ